MKDDFEIINYNFKNEIYIVPIFDVHYGSSNFDERLWKRTKNIILNNENVYCVFGGDIIDNQTKNSHSPFGNTTRPFNQKEWYKQQVKDLKDKILCGTIGNHTMRKDNVASDDNIDYDVFENAGIEDRFRPNVCFLKIQIGDRNDHNRCAYMFEITHSTGGGTSLGGIVNKQEKALNVYEGLDCVIVGHTHKPINFPTNRVVIDSKNNKISQRTIQVIVSPSYLKYGDYALRGQMQSAPYEDIVLKLTKRRNKKIIKINDYEEVR